MKPPLIRKLDLAMCDKSKAVELASRIILGLECQHLKQELGYHGEGAWWGHVDKTNPGKRLTWPQFTREQAGISERSAELYFQCAQAAMTRLRCLGRPGSKKLLRLMEKQPSTMTRAARADMIQKLIRLVLSVGETQRQLLREYRGVHLPKPEKIAESGNEGRVMSLAELKELYPYEEDAKEYAMVKLLGFTEEKARLLMVVRQEMRRRESLGMKRIGS